jgi:O-antigen/teichoic acid export membrane protein
MSGQPGLMRSVATLFSGTVIAQGIPFLAAPLIARQYGPDQFAVFGTLMAVFNILNVLAAARYEMAVVMPARDAESADLVRGALVISLIMGVLSFGAVLLFGLSTRLAERLPGLPDVAWIAALLAVLAGSQVVLQQWLLRRKRFGAVARAKVVQALGITAATVGLGYCGFVNGLEVGYLIGWTGFTLATAWWVFGREPLAGPFDGSRSITALKAYREWPLVNTWPALINAVASGMATFYMASYFDGEVAGQHNFVRQYVLVPVSMVTVALGQVLFVRASERVREGRPLMPELSGVFAVLAVGAVVLVAVLMFFGEPLFRWIFGERWAFAGTAGRYLVFGYAAQLVCSPFNVLLLALRHVKLTILFPALFMGLLLLLPLFRHQAPLRFMGLLSAVEVVAYTLQLAVVFLCVQRHDRSLAA